MRTLRDLLTAWHLSPEERQDQCAERCLESLCDAERAHSLPLLGEHEEAVIETERRRWESRRAAQP
jgi:hypothetical protein